MSPRKKEEWIEVTEAASIVSGNSGHEVSVDYIRLLGAKGRIHRKEKNRREHLYLKGDAEQTIVKQRRKKETATGEESQSRRNDQKAA